MKPSTEAGTFRLESEAELVDAFKEIAVKSGLEASSWKTMYFRAGGQEWVKAETLYKNIVKHGLDCVLLCRKDGRSFLYTDGEK